jgi:hypothetical protein
MHMYLIISQHQKFPKIIVRNNSYTVCAPVSPLFFIFIIKPTSPYCKEGGGGNCVLVYSNKYLLNVKNLPYSFYAQLICTVPHTYTVAI